MTTSPATALSEALAKATEGPWFVHDFTGALDDWLTPSPGDVTVSCDHPATITVASMGRALTATVAEARANAAFIAAAKTHLPELLAENAAMRAEIERLSAHLEVAEGCPFSNPSFEMDVNKPCPVCGMLGTHDADNTCPFPTKSQAATRRGGFHARDTLYATQARTEGRNLDGSERRETVAWRWRWNAAKVWHHQEETPEPNPRVPMPLCEEAAAEITRLRTEAAQARATGREDALPRYRHKRGSTYELIGIGKMQAENWTAEHKTHDQHGEEMVCVASVDMREVAIYRDVETGSLWVRPREEFEDGRFERLARAFNEETGR